MPCNSSSSPPVSGGAISEYSNTCRMRRLAPSEMQESRAVRNAACDAADKSVATRSRWKDGMVSVAVVCIGVYLFSDTRQQMRLARKVHPHKKDINGSRYVQRPPH